MKPLLFLAALAAPAFAQQDPAAENAKLREALRATAVQLRTAQADLANAQATTAAAEAKNKNLEQQLAKSGEALAAQTKRASEDKVAAERSIASLNNKVAERDKRLTEYTEALAKWKAAYQQAASAAQAKEAESAAAATRIATLKNTLADRERKNIALFNVANEILDRYRDHGLGKAILAKEPFTQNTRVKIELLVQGYQDRILENRISAKP